MTPPGLIGLKKKILRYNHSPFMTNKLRKEIMKRSKLKRIFNVRKNYTKQRNFCYSLLRRTKKEYFESINIKNISESRTFWKTVTPYFSKNQTTSNKLMLIENDEILTEEKKLANTMNDFFLNITKNLEIKKYPNMKVFDFDTLKSIFENHDSIKKIKQFHTNDSNEIFSFGEVTVEEVKKEILTLNNKKASTNGSIPVTILKQTLDTYIVKLTNTINHSILINEFPDNLKKGEVIPIYKKNDPLKKDNYRPVTLLSHLSKVFERIMHKQIYAFMENKLSKYLTGFRKNHGTQHSLASMLENWKNALDKGEYVCALFMDLSKAFDTINHDLMLAKLEAYGFSNNSLQFMHNYLKNRKQRVQLNNSFSKMGKVKVGVPQGSIIGPLLFNIFINDFIYFIEHCNISNYADDNTMYGIGKDKETTKFLLDLDFQTVAKWFYANAMVLNPEKCHYMCLGSNVDNMEEFNSLDYKLNNSEEETMLGIKIDRKLNFQNHINDLCRKASQKINALNRIASYIDVHKRKIIYTSIIKSQFSYCPLVWMFCSRNSNTLINKVQERALRISLQDNESDFCTLLSKNKEVSIHHRNIQVLVTEIFKVMTGVAPPIMQNLFEVRENKYNLRNFREIQNSVKNTVKCGLETISYRSSALWSLVPQEIKSEISLAAFKSKIKNWQCNECPCRLCRVFVANVGFID